jgi:hypothetical protein
MAYIGGFLSPWFQNDPNEKAMRNMVRVGIREGKEIAAENTPVQTGDLREHWTESEHIGKTVSFLGIGWEGSWENDLDYAPYVNYGTGLYGPEHRKYLIVPKTPGGTLHWVDRLTGEDRYAKAVLHPGSPGHHMLEISAAWLEATWERLVRPVLTAWAREVERQNPYATFT